MWSFVANKGNKQWIGLALDIETREVVGVYVASRNRDGAKQLWSCLPAVYRQCAVAYTDFCSADEEVFPVKRHKSEGIESGKTTYIERFNGTLPQRVSPLVRTTLSFSKKLENHIGAILYACSPLKMHPYLFSTTKTFTPSVETRGHSR